MTFSIVARSGDALGVATATRSLAVGAVVPAAAPATGALATQARTNRAFRSRGLRLMRDGAAPSEVLRALAGEDTGFDQRQVALVDATGRSAVWTGPECLPWAGGWSRDGLAVAGNLLVGREVLEAMEAAFAAEPDASFTRRLLAALMAGDSAGGDRRGRQSAAIVVVAGEDDGAWPPLTRVDLRVDDHPDPVGELGRLVELVEADAEGDAAARAVVEPDAGGVPDGADPRAAATRGTDARAAATRGTDARAAAEPGTEAATSPPAP